VISLIFLVFQAKTWGTAYLLPKDEEKEIIEYLEYREKQYDSRVNLDLFTDNAETPVVTSARVYIATSASETYMGVASVDALAKYVVTALHACARTNILPTSSPLWKCICRICVV